MAAGGAGRRQDARAQVARRWLRTALTGWLRGRGVPGSHEVLGDPATDPPAEQGRAWTINRIVAGDVCSV